MIVLRKYVPSPGHDEVEAWYAGLAPKERAKTRVNLDYLRQSKTRFAKPRFEHITSGPGKGLGEIKVRQGKVRTRLIGFFGPCGDDFTVLIVVQKASRRLPNRVWDTAQSRKRRVENDWELADVWEI